MPMIIEKCWKLIRFPSGGNDGSRFYSRNISPQKIPVGFNPNGIFYCPLGLLTEQYGVLHMYCVYVEDSQVYDGGASCPFA